MSFLFLAAIASLGLWIILHDKAYSRIFNTLFLISISAHFIFRFWSNTLEPYSLLNVSIELLGLSLLCLLLLLFKSQKLIQYFILVIGLLAAKHYSSPEMVGLNHSQNIDSSFELMVECENGKVSNELLKISEMYNLIIEPAFHISPSTATSLDEFFKIDIPVEHQEIIQKIYIQIQKSSGVVWIEYNEIFRLNPLKNIGVVKGNFLKNVNDPMTDRQWALQALDMDAYYQWFKQEGITPNKRVKLFILDTGVDSNHPDLKHSFASGRSENSKDNHGHGTLCAGVAAAVTNNQIGIASMCPSVEFVELHSVKVISDFGIGSQIAIIDGIIEAVDKGADVISMSLGGRATASKEKSYEEAIRYATEKGTIVVVAAGNSNSDANGFSPANSDAVITVSAVDSLLQRAHFSNFVQHTTYGLAAPGTKIYSTYKNGSYAFFDGTSFAAPMVAGLISVMKSINPQLDIEEAFNILHNSGKVLKQGEETGKLIQPAEAMKLLMKQSF